MSWIRLRVALLSACFFSLALCAVRADTLDDVLAQLEQVHSFSGVSISPDGRWVAWLERRASNSNTLYVLDWKKPGAKPKAVRTDADTENTSSSEIVWAPDSKQFAFMS